MADVIGSAEIEVRATTRQLKSDMVRAEKEAKAELKKVEAAAKDAQRELKRAFSDTGQDEFQRSMRVIRNASEYTEKEVRDAARRVAQDLKGRYRDLGADIGQTLMGVSRTAQIAFAAITAYSLKLAADAGEIESAFAVAFGSAEADARSFSDTLADEVGRDAVVLRESMTRLQLVLTGTGVAASTAADMVKALTASGVDAGSLFNTSDAEALQKIISGLTGETEPLKAFGVVISQAAVEAELLRLGFQGNASEASEAAKSIARANLIIEGLSVAQGDAARTADSAANTTKRMTAEFNKAARDLGTELLPAMVKVFGAATDVLRAFNDLPGGMQVAGLAMLGLIAAGGPIAGLIANLSRVIRLARDTRAALIAIGTGGAAAGAGGAAGAAAAGSSLALPLAVGAGVLSQSGSAGPVDLDATIRQRERRLREASPAQRPALERDLDSLYQARAQRTAQLEAQAFGAVADQARDVGITPGRNEPGTVVGGFSLPPSLANPGGGGGARGAGSSASYGPTEEELANMRESLDLQATIDLARASGDEAALKAAQDRQTVIRLTADYERAGYDDAEARATAQVAAVNDAIAKQELLASVRRKMIELQDEFVRSQERTAELMAMQLSDQILLADLSGDEGMLKHLLREEEIRRRIVDLMRLTPGLTEDAARAQATQTVDARDAAARVGDMREEFRDAFSGGIQAAIDGDLGSCFDSLADRFTSRLLDNLADDLFDILQSALKGQSGGGAGGIVSAIGSFFGFGGGRAAGGPMAGGRWFNVGEHGPERILMPQDGFAIPNALPVGAGGAMQRQQLDVVVTADRDGLTAFVRDQAGQVAGPLVIQGGAAAASYAKSDTMNALQKQQSTRRGGSGW